MKAELSWSAILRDSSQSSVQVDEQDDDGATLNRNVLLVNTVRVREVGLKEGLILLMQTDWVYMW